MPAASPVINMIQNRPYPQCLALLCMVLFGAVPACAWAGEATAQTVTTEDAVTTIGPCVSVSVAKHEVYLEATVCLRRGILEYLICKSRTFEHESIFATECKPSYLHAALLLIGTEPIPDADTYDWADKIRTHAPSLLSIDVEYENAGALQRKHISGFLSNRERKDGIVPDRWAFAGSVFYERDGQQLYAADSTGGVIGLSPKGAPVVQFGERLGSPYQGEAEGVECAEDGIPPRGTRVRVILSPYGSAPPVAGPAVRHGGAKQAVPP